MDDEGAVALPAGKEKTGHQVTRAQQAQVTHIDTYWLHVKEIDRKTVENNQKENLNVDSKFEIETYLSMKFLVIVFTIYLMILFRI